MSPPAGAPRPQTVLVAGTAGGVGTTTVVALLAAVQAQRGQGTPVLVDHTYGALAERLPPELSRRSAGQLSLHDLGVCVTEPTAALLAAAPARLLLVSAATPLGVSLAAATVERLAAGTTDPEPARVRVVLVAVHGRHRLSRRSAGLPDGVAMTLLPRDSTLAAGGPVPWEQLSRRTRTGLAELADALGGSAADPVSTTLANHTRPPTAADRTTRPSGTETT